MCFLPDSALSAGVSQGSTLQAPEKGSSVTKSSEVFSGVLNGGVDFLTLDFFNGVLHNKHFPLDPVLKGNFAFLLLGGDCFMSGVIGDCFMSGVFGVAGLVIPF